MRIMVEPKPECPNLVKKSAGDETYYLCDINDKFCPMEYGYNCEYYEEWLKETK